jgi:DNA polymerase-3 subunit epsilon
MREVVLDTETTGLDPLAGHRVIEIGCVELINHLPSGRAFQRYVNPERDIPADAFAVHGLSAAFLAAHPPFDAVADELMAFLGDAPLIIHNAEFDLRFINWELQLVGRQTVPADRAVDTVALARRRYPGSPASLDALCRRFAIDNTARTKHGALLDAELLAEVYLELIGGREPGLALGQAPDTRWRPGVGQAAVRPPRPHAASPHERAAHAEFLAELTKPLWLADER